VGEWKIRKILPIDSIFRKTGDGWCCYAKLIIFVIQDADITGRLEIGLITSWRMGLHIKSAVD
jgi:hypothetical protein